MDTPNRTSSCAGCLISIALCAAFVPVTRAEETAPARAKPRLHFRARVEVRETEWALTLREAIALGLQQNLGAKIERIGVDIAGARLLAERATLDPTFTSRVLYESSLTPQNTQEFVATRTVQREGSRLFSEDNIRSGFSIEGKTGLGTLYEVGMELNQLRNTLNIELPPSLFYPEYGSFAGVQITQPLLKDFGPQAALAGIRVARSEKKIAGLAWRLRVEKLVADISRAYFDVLFAQSDIGIKEATLREATSLLSDNRKKVEQGVGSKLDVNQAASAAALREEELLSARQFYRERRNILARELVADVDAARPPRFRLTDPLTAPREERTNRPALARRALETRTEYQQLLEQVRKQDIRILYAKNQSYPKLDLVGSFGANGLDADAGGALGDAFDYGHPKWSVGLRFSIPFGGRAGQAQLRQARLEKEQLLLNLKQTEVDLVLQVDTVLSRVETSRERLRVTERSISSAASTLEGEKLRLLEGVGVNLLVLEAQRDLSAAKSRQLAAIADYQKTLVDLWLTTGQLLERHHVTLEPEANSPRSSK